MTIYIDVILIENLLMNSIILFATGLVLKTKIRTTRIIISSLIGAIQLLHTFLNLEYIQIYY